MRKGATTATVLAAMAAAAPTAPTFADDDRGYYFTESVGVGQARGELAPIVGNAVQTRLAVGVRVKWLALEPWIRSDMQLDREGAFKGILGGEPADGRADLEAYGVDAKLIGSLYQSPNGERVEAYLRGGGALAAGTGMLEHYRGTSVGAAAGIQIKGRVRALGFLWAPLFFVKRGPKITGALYLDQGFDFYRLRDATSTINARIGHVSVGFSLGSTF